MVGAKSYPMEERSVRNPVIKEPFDFRMEIRQYEPRIKALEIGVERIEQSVVAIVERLKVLKLENNDSGMDYSGAFESDIKYG